MITLSAVGFTLGFGLVVKVLTTYIVTGKVQVL